jgi:L,D-transpeptidase catalytic domain
MKTAKAVTCLAAAFLLFGFPLTGLAYKPEVRTYSKIPKSIGYGGRVFVFNPRHNYWAAYKSGRLVGKGRASGGKSYCPDVGRRCLTPRGHFRVYSKGPASCKSSKYPVGRGGAKMPYCMFFYRGYAIHGSYNVPRRNASHGCIRVRPNAARWLSRQFMQHGTKVIVKPY